ncbi:MAG: hypothetical protein HY554_13595 [Elusimicrobia bacterium]|nr:hypothetical protein [Elusimicrobiota bacterium]
MRRAPLTFARTLRRPDAAVKRNAVLLASSARLRLFGLGLNPYRLFVQESPAGPAGEAAPGAGSPAAGGAARSRRLRFSLDPVLDDLRNSLPGDLRREAINRGFDLAVPSADRSPFWQKEVVVDDLMQLRRHWQETWDERQALEP